MWDFSEYHLDELLRIRDSTKLLQSYGLDQDEDMLFELAREIERKEVIV